MGLFGPDRNATRTADNVTRLLREQREADEREERREGQRKAEERRRAEPRRPKDKLSNTKRTR